MDRGLRALAILRHETKIEKIAAIIEDMLGQVARVAAARVG